MDISLANDLGELTLGIGCRSGVDAATLTAAIAVLLGATNGRLRCLATLDRRQEEPALRAAARSLQVPLNGFNAQALQPYEAQLTHRSARTHALTGCWGVAESAALAAAGAGGRLIVPRRADASFTLALATAGREAA